MFKKSAKRSALTLLELMIVVGILADLAVIALPSFIRSRDMAQNTKYITDNRTACGAFEMYVAENNVYPPDTAPALVPQGMSIYLGNFPWTEPNSLGAQWQWMLNEYSTTAQVAIVFPGPGDDIRMQDIDQRIDDGILSTGAFRKQAASIYTYTLEW